MVRDRWTMSTARDKAGEQPVPPFGSSLLSMSPALRAWVFSFCGCCTHACCPHKCHCSVGTPQGPRSWTTATVSLARGEVRRPITCACMALGCMEGCFWAATCWRLWQAWDYNSRCSKPMNVPTRLKLGVEDREEPKMWVRGQRWRAEPGRTRKLPLRAGFDAKLGNSREMSCCRFQMCNFLFFLTQLVLNEMRWMSNFWI